MYEASWQTWRKRWRGYAFYQAESALEALKHYCREDTNEHSHSAHNLIDAWSKKVDCAWYAYHHRSICKTLHGHQVFESRHKIHLGCMAAHAAEAASGDNRYHWRPLGSQTRCSWSCIQSCDLVDGRPHRNRALFHECYRDDRDTLVLLGLHTGLWSL